MQAQTRPHPAATADTGHRDHPTPTARPRPWRRIVTGLVLAALLLVVVPPVLRLLAPQDERTLQGVTAGVLDVTPVRFTNEADQLDLAGQLFLPDTAGPHPAVALINGSGPSVRTNRWYLTISAHLVDQGIAVLWPDKRGSGDSDGDWQTASFDALARDAHASLDHLRSRPDVDPTRVGVIGMSQGGRIASIVAAEDDRLAYAVSFVGGVLPAHASLRFEETHNLRQMGFLPGVADVLAHASSWAVVNLAQPELWKAVGDFDPLPNWARTDVPVLFQLGAADTNVDTPGSVARLRTLDDPDLRIEVYEGSGHALQQPAGEGDALIRPEALEDLTAFIANTMADV